MAVRPPVSPSSWAVMRLPIRAHTLGAMLVILVSTKSRIDAFAAAKASYSSHPCRKYSVRQGLGCTGGDAVWW